MSRLNWVIFRSYKKFSRNVDFVFIVCCVEPIFKILLKIDNATLATSKNSLSCLTSFTRNLRTNMKIYTPYSNISGFGGLGVVCCPLVPKFAGSNPAEALGLLGRNKILSTPSFGVEVKPSVPCRRFSACKRSLNLRGSRNFGKNYRTSFSITFPPFAARISRIVTDVQAPGGESGNV